MPCLFCKEERPLTREHVLPNWLSELYPNETLVINKFVGGSNQEWSSKIFQHKLRGVCETCNGGWMAKLEAEVKPIFIKLYNLESVTIYERSQNLLAFWAQKSILMLNHSIPGGLKITQDMFDDLYKNKSVSKKALVSLGWRLKHKGSKNEPIASFTIRQIPSVDVPKNLYGKIKEMQAGGGFIWRATMAIGPVVFELAGHNMKILLEIGTDNQTLKIIRPFQGDIKWPIEWPIEAVGGLDSLSKSI